MLYENRGVRKLARDKKEGGNRTYYPNKPDKITAAPINPDVLASYPCGSKI